MPKSFDDLPPEVNMRIYNQTESMRFNAIFKLVSKSFHNIHTDFITKKNKETVDIIKMKNTHP